jgi:endo-1,4-beta-D-glucanase Y
MFALAGCVKKPDPDPRTVPTGSLPMRPQQPFGHHTFDYAKGSIVPGLADRASMDQSTASAYDEWKGRYLKPGCVDGEHRVLTETGVSKVGGSEAHGYGMVIVALMAGHDPHAGTYFDGLLNYFLSHQSALTDGLMAWQQDGACRDTDGDHSFSGGDLDIAYALLLADKQWGSCGPHDYRGEARRVISAITRGELHREGRYILLGDWVDASQRRLYDTARTSDFVPGHFRSYQRFMGQSWWLGVIDNGYWLLETMQAQHSPKAGLFPEYVSNADSEHPRAALAGFRDDASAHRYALHASSVPWRLGSDFLVSGENRARRILTRLNAFVQRQAEGDPGRIGAGFSLDGTPSSESDSMMFTAPLGVSAMVAPENQAWLDAIWTRVAQAPSRSFHDDTARLISMLLMSNNWWPPEHGSDPCAHAAGSKAR